MPYFLESCILLCCYSIFAVVDFYSLNCTWTGTHWQCPYPCLWLCLSVLTVCELMLTVPWCGTVMKY